MKISEALYRTADLIEKRGWTAGPHGWCASGKVCVEGALCAVLGLEPKDDPLMGKAYLGYDLSTQEAARVLADFVGVKVDRLWYWNDRIARDETLVVEGLRAAALLSRMREAIAEDEGAAHMGYVELAGV